MCITVTVVDGIVLARSAFNMSMNYRAVVVQGAARLVTTTPSGWRPSGRSWTTSSRATGTNVRPPNEQELRQTLVVAADLDEASAKVSSGPPGDEPEDLALPHWAGEIPLRTVAGTPVPDAHVQAGVEPPESVRDYARVFDAPEVPSS